MLILANFTINCLEKEFDPYPMSMQRYRVFWQLLSDLFNIIWLLELVLHFYGASLQCAQRA